MDTSQSLRINNTNVTGAFCGVMLRLYHGVLYSLDVCHTVSRYMLNAVSFASVKVPYV
jgi:hypothetical protein